MNKVQAEESVPMSWLAPADEVRIMKSNFQEVPPAEAVMFD